VTDQVKHLQKAADSASRVGRVYAQYMARNIAKHGPKVVDMTERRREAIELDRFIMERGGLRLLPRRPATWLSKPTAAAAAPPTPTDDDLAPFR
jgi:hypothetical protein